MNTRHSVTLSDWVEKTLLLAIVLDLLDVGSGEFRTCFARRKV